MLGSLLAEGQDAAADQKFWDTLFNIIGIILALLGNVGVNVGTNLVSLYHHDCENSEDGKGRLWVQTAGFVVYVIGAIVSFAAYAFGSQIVIAALGSVGFISNIFCQKLMFGCPITLRMGLAAMFIIAANLCIVIPGNIASERGLTAMNTTNINRDARELFQLYGEDSFQGAVLACLACIMILQHQFDSVAEREELSTSDVSNLDRQLQCYRYIAISGFIGSAATTLAKSCSGLLTLCFMGENQFLIMFTYVILIGWIHFMQIWLGRMDTALKLFDSFAVPLIELVWTLFSIIAGGIYFKEFDWYSLEDALAFVAGVVLMGIGVYLFAPQDPDEGDELEHDDAGMEGGVQRESRAGSLKPGTHEFEDYVYQRHGMDDVQRLSMLKSNPLTGTCNSHQGRNSLKRNSFAVGQGGGGGGGRLELEMRSSVGTTLDPTEGQTLSMPGGPDLGHIDNIGDLLDHHAAVVKRQVRESKLGLGLGFGMPVGAHSRRRAGTVGGRANMAQRASTTSEASVVSNRSTASGFSGGHSSISVSYRKVKTAILTERGLRAASQRLSTVSGASTAENSHGVTALNLAVLNSSQSKPELLRAITERSEAEEEEGPRSEAAQV